MALYKSYARLLIKITHINKLKFILLNKASQVGSMWLPSQVLNSACVPITDGEQHTAYLTIFLK